MIDPVRRDVLQVLAELSEVVPEVRLGQLMANLSYLARGLTSEAIWDMEDEELLAAAREHLSNGDRVAEPLPDFTGAWVHRGVPGLPARPCETERCREDPGRPTR